MYKRQVTPALRLLAAAVRPLAWDKQGGHPINRRLYLPEYCLSAHDPSFGRDMDLPLVMAALMNRWGEDILPEEVAYVMEDKTTGSTSNGAFAAAAAGCCGFPCWQAWMDLQDLREQIHDGCSVAVRIERRIRGQRDPIGVWMGLRGFGHDDAVLADYVLLNDPTADSDGAVNCTMAVTDFARYFTGRAIALRPKPRDTEANRPRRVSCDFVYSAEDDCWYLAQKGQRRLLPAEFSGWAACSPHDGVAHATTAHRTRPRASCSCRAAAAASSGARVPAARLSGPAAGVRKYPPAVQPQPRKLRSAAAAATSASMGSRMHPAPGAPRTPPVPHASPTVSIRSTSLRGRYTQLTSPLTS